MIAIHGAAMNGRRGTNMVRPRLCWHQVIAIDQAYSNGGGAGPPDGARSAIGQC
jgi:hypothetical protein